MPGSFAKRPSCPEHRAPSQQRSRHASDARSQRPRRLRRKRYARSPSIPPTKRKRFGATCRRRYTSSSNSSSAAVPTGWIRRVARASRATCSSSPATTTAAIGRNEFFSDRWRSREFLPVDELERVSCSELVAGTLLAAQGGPLFGCNTLNPQPHSSDTGRDRRGPRARRSARARRPNGNRVLGAGHGESSRDRMRQMFKDVPVIYGFSSVAPLGPIAASTSSSYFRHERRARVATKATRKSPARATSRRTR